MSEFEFRGAAIADLIGRPVVAIVKANQMMAKEQVKLLMRICFSGTGDVYEPVMITMSMRRGAIEPGDDNDSVSIRQKTVNFQVPLITLLPINSLAIEDVDIGFDMDVHSQYEVIEEGDDRLFGDVSSSPTKSYELAGSIKYESRDKTEGAEVGGSRAAPVSISVSAGTLPLPLGVSTIVQAYSQAIHPSDASHEQKNDKK
jgi:hypothetical protein